MTPHGMNVFNKTALTLVSWMSILVAAVACVSNGNLFAVCVASGLPLGVLALWVIVHVSDKGHVVKPKKSPAARKRILDRRSIIAKVIVVRMPLQSIGRMQAPRVSRTRITPVSLGSPRSQPDQEVKAQWNLDETSVGQFSLDEDTVVSGMTKVSTPTVVKVAVFHKPNKDLFDAEFVNHVQYLYSPGQNNLRQTLNLGRLSRNSEGEIPEENVRDSLSSLSVTDNRKVPKLDLDWND
ncbi:MAG: hypothetical protein H7249_14135 [Chitinophagaceae bacterium]|nr:hypothetical protein [Oligoflexus sp.]